MNPPSLLTALLPLMADLAQDLPEAERHRRLLETLRVLLPCDAAAMLRLDGDWLVPLAVDGLSRDTLGRRFRVTEHPRFMQLLAAPAPVRFAADCGLPDPFDGLVDGVQGHLPVHDCMGCALRVDGRPWGLLTLDALDVGRFSHVELDVLQAFASLAAATVALATRMHGLAVRAEDERLRADSYAQAADHAARQLVGHSAAHKRLMKEIALAAPTDLCVLIQGETGTGKELVAQALHAASTRARRPLVSINCAALPDSLVESELFGHVRGAFTGAVTDRRGKFELADGGTLFLDEVAELPLQVQAKLLRVLQGGQLQRLGSDREHHVDVRVIAASNRNLAEEVRAGRLRADFYHRLSVYPLQVPPLRERGRDVLPIGGFFLEEARSRMGLGAVRLDAGAQAALLAYDWPGNVRELEHLLGRSVVKALGRHAQRPRILTLGADDLGLGAAAAAGDSPGHQTVEAHARLADPTDIHGAPPDSAQGLGLRDAVADLERRMVLQALEQHGQQWAAAARALRIDPANLARMCKRLGIARG
ncbi:MULTISPECIES: nitric oxide reductase transcriptional regulator NorR [unclassified Variovorax]|uniref:nitric oxide reductase transcriptional regulator NorR n=1 Tax=unclassified Variovorax TaxID=663243 RepID=UPI003F488726